ncbi:MAG: hypothetical protein M1449_08870 [Candidatus Thermoplasmatota archaeon]|nr:hypothetical protein [Candidatus Thermoplasmatota archaeon]
MSMAGSDSLRLSNTPTTTQAVRCFSGAPLFMLNSSSISLFSMSVLKKIQFAAASPSGVAGWMVAPRVGVADWAIIGAGAAECQKSVRVANAFRNARCSIAAR